MIEEINQHNTVPYEKLFPSQQPHERIIVAVREHWFRLFLKVFVVALLSLLPWIFKALLLGTSILDSSNTAVAIVNTLSSVFYLGLMVALFVIFVLHYLNIHIVSEDRIVDIDQTGLLYREVSELNIETIEDVSSQKKGLLGNIFNYGTVYVQTAGAVERFEFDNVGSPDKISSVILQLYEQHGTKEQPKP